MSLYYSSYVPLNILWLLCGYTLLSKFSTTIALYLSCTVNTHNEACEIHAYKFKKFKTQLL